MVSRSWTVAAAMLASAFLYIDGSASAGESPYNPGGATPAVPQDFSYVCVAGNVGTYHTLYITAAHHADWPVSDSTGIRKASAAWTAAIHSQPYPFNAHCVLDHTEHVQQLRQSLLAQPHDKTVNIDWQYGQAGPARVISSASPAAPAATSPAVGNAASSTPAQAAPPPPVSVPVYDSTQMNQQMHQAGQNLLNNLLGH